jgi:hypothetical protein
VISKTMVQAPVLSERAEGIFRVEYWLGGERTSVDYSSVRGEPACYREAFPGQVLPPTVTVGSIRTTCR